MSDRVITIKAIETAYRGYLFRSRLEARWAVCFDALGVRWDYEAEGFDLGDGVRYLPDFWLPEWKAFAEVKPDEPTVGELEKCAALAMQSGHYVLLLDGTPDVQFYQAMLPDAGGYDWVDLEKSHDKGRVWIHACGSVRRPPASDLEFAGPGGTLAAAVAAARSARFEYGESGVRR